MIENKKFGIYFEDEVKKAVNSLSRQEMQKYLYAKKYQLKNLKFYQDLLNKKVVDLFSNGLEAYLKKNLENNDKAFIENLSKLLNKSMYAAFDISSKSDRNDLARNIRNFIRTIDIDSLVNQFTLSYVEEAKDLFKNILNSDKFINKVVHILNNTREKNKTAKIFASFRTSFNDTVDESSFSDAIKEELLGLFPTNETAKIFSNDKVFYELINNMLISLEKGNVIDIMNREIIINSRKFNEEKEKFYESNFSSGNKIADYNPYLDYQTERADLIKDIIKLAYTSATQEVNYTVFKNQEILFQNNSTIIPLGIYKRIMSSKYFSDIIDSAMSNYYMFLSGNEVVFYDNEGRKCSFPIKSIHILGLNDKAGGPGSTQEDMLYQYFVDNLASDQTNTHSFFDDIQHYRFDGYNFSNIYFFLDDSFKKTLGDCVKDLFDFDIIDEVPLSKRIESLINAQGIVTSYMTTNDYERKLDLLVYFYSKLEKSPVAVNNGVFQKITRKDYAVLDSILDENSYYFGNSFITYFKTKGRTEMFNKFCEKYNNPVEQSKIYNRINTIIELQEFLTYQHRNIASEILKLSDANSEIDVNIWKKYFGDSIKSMSVSYDDKSSSLNTSDGVLNEGFNRLDIINESNGRYTIKGIYTTKSNTEKEEDICTFILDSEKKILDVNKNSDYEVELNGSRRFRIHKKNRYNEFINITTAKDELEVEYLSKGLGTFPLADLYINSQVKKISSDMANQSEFVADINILKILNKLLYLTHFNYSLDITNLFLNDLQKEDSVGVICEMMALDNVLTALFEYKDEDDTMHFVSVQDADSLLFVSSIVSMMPNLVNFFGNQYKTLLAFSEYGNSGFSNILTQSQSDFKKKKMEYEYFVKDLINGKITLRCSTSGAMLDNKELIDNFLYSTKSFNLIDLIKRNLYGCSNALLWLEVVNLDEFRDFTNVKLPLLMDGNGKLEYLKILLYKKVQNNILEITTLLEREIVYYSIVDMLQEYKLTGNEEILDDILKDISSILIKNDDTLEELSYLDRTDSQSVCDFIEKCIERYSSAMFIKDNQLGECKVLLEKLKNNQYINNISLEIVDKILALNPDDLETFNFISNMNQDELNEFRKNIYLVYPSYIVSFLCKKFKLLNELPNNHNLEIINSDLLYITDNASLTAPVEYVNSLVGVKDDERSLLLYLESKISSYNSYIENGNLLSLSKDDSKTGNSLDEYLKLSNDLLCLMAQKRDLLAKKNIEFGEKLEEKGMLNAIKNLVVATEVRKAKIEVEIKMLDCKIRDDKEKNELLSFINDFLHSKASNVSIADINKLFSLGSYLLELPNGIVSEVIKKIDLLIASDGITNNSEILNGLLALKGRIECDIKINAKLSNIRDILKWSIDKLYVYKTRLLENGQVEYRQIRNSDNSVAFESANIRDTLQLELDDKVKKEYSSFYSFVNDKLMNYPTYHKLYLEDLDERVKRIFENQKMFMYKDSFELFIKPHILKFREGIIAINIAARNKLKEFLKEDYFNEDLSNQLSFYYKEEKAKIAQLCVTCFKNSIDALNSNHYLKTNDDIQRLNQYMESLANSFNIISEYSSLLLSLFQDEYKMIVLEHVGLFEIGPYIDEEKVFVSKVKSLISKYLTFMNSFLIEILKEENVFADNGKQKEEYFNSFRDGIIKIVYDETLVSRQFDRNVLNDGFEIKSTK